MNIPHPPLPLREAKKRFVKQYLETLLELHGGNVVQAAKTSGVNRTNFYELMDRVGITDEFLFKVRFNFGTLDARLRENRRYRFNSRFGVGLVCQTIEPPPRVRPLK